VWQLLEYQAPVEKHFEGWKSRPEKWKRLTIHVFGSMRDGTVIAL